MLNPYLFDRISSKWIKEGRAPFQWDIASSTDGSNSFCKQFLHRNKRYQSNFDTLGSTCWANPDHRQISSYVRHFLHLHARDNATELAIVTPFRPSAAWWPLLIRHFKLAMRLPGNYMAPKHSEFKRLFIRPSSTTPNHREDVGPCPYDVCVWFSTRKTLCDDPVTIATIDNSASYSEPVSNNYFKLKHQLGQLTTVRAVFQGTSCSVLLDSGAQVNLINASLVSKLKLPTVDTDMEIGWVSAKSSERITKAVENVTISMGGHPFFVEYALVTELASFDFILGSHWLERRQAIQQFYGTKHVSLVSSRNKRVLLRPVPHLPRRRVEVCLASAESALKLIRRGATAYLLVVSGNGKVVSSALDPLLDKMIDPSCECKSAVQNLLHQFASVFKEKADLPPLNEHAVDLKVKPGAQPVNIPPFRVTPEELEALKEFVQRLVDRGWIAPSDSPWASPVMLLTKPCGGLRMVIDYRRVNDLLASDGWPLPRADALYDQLANKKVFSKFDLTEGYFQLRVTPSSEPVTSFCTPFGNFAWKVLPMGVKTAPSAFSRMMATVLKPCIDAGWCSVYLDDVLIHSCTEEEHLRHLQTLFEAMRKAGLCFKPQKSIIFARQVTFLGQLVTSEGIAPSPHKLKALAEFPVPDVPVDLSSFLGLAQWFKRFIPSFSHIAAPLYDLTQLAKWDETTWTPVHQAAFDMLKEILTSDAAVSHFLPDLPTALWVDASGYAIGSCLVQKHPDGWRPCGFFSRKLAKSELSYPIRDKEWLAVVRSCDFFSVWLRSVSRPFTIVTDHHSLTFYSTTKLQQERHIRWYESLSKFNFNILYRAGSSNFVADALSRNPKYRHLQDYVHRTRYLTRFSSVATDTSDLKPPPSLSVGEPHDASIGLFSASIPLDVVANEGSRSISCQHNLDTSAKWSNNPKVNQVLETSFQYTCQVPSDLEALLRAAHQQDFAALGLQRDNLGFWRTAYGQLYLPPGTEEPVLYFLHRVLAHVGRDRTFQAVKKLVWCKYLQSKVANVAKRCVHCAAGKHKRQKSAKGSTFLGSHAFVNTTPATPYQPDSQSNSEQFDILERIGIDFSFGLPQVNSLSGIAVFRDLFSGYTVLTAISPHLTSSQLSQLLLNRWIAYFGVPKHFVSDNDSRFLGEAWQHLTETLKVKTSFTSVYNPRANGSVERTNSFVSELLRSTVHALGNQRAWVEMLPWIQYCMNATVGPSGVSANELLFGKDFSGFGILEVSTPSLSSDDKVHLRKLVHDRLTTMHKDQLDHANKFASVCDVQVGNMVDLKTTHLRLKKGSGKKLVPLWLGPFPVTRVIKQGNHVVACELDLPSTWNVSRTWNVSYLKKSPVDSLSSFVADYDLESDMQDVVQSDDTSPLPNLPPVIGMQVQFHSFRNGITSFRVKFSNEDIWPDRIWSEEQVRMHPFGATALNDYYHSLKSRTRSRT